ncbi:MAG: phosphotransferase [Deltaproteobacteria bacterium]|nr:phosphotransferase [Deltaproteobacteria bacterium]
MDIEVVKAEAARITGKMQQRVEIVRLPKDASARTYYRLSLLGDNNDPSSMIVMELGPGMGMSAEEVTDGPDPAEPPFLEIRQYLEDQGLPVPRLYATDRKNGLLYLEDFGDVTLESMAITRGVDTLAIYKKAVSLLVDFQKTTRMDQRRNCIAFKREFNPKLLLWELNHFREWMLEKRNIPLTPGESGLMEESFASLVQKIYRMDQVLVHRDFQSRNLMVQPGGSIGILDFQDALLGPLPYDLVALLRDSYVELTAVELENLIGTYIDLSAREGNLLDKDVFFEQFALVTLQRKLKDAGRFVFIDKVKNNPSFLKHIPTSLSYVNWALNSIEGFDDLHYLLEEKLGKDLKWGDLEKNRATGAKKDAGGMAEGAKDR